MEELQITLLRIAQALETIAGAMTQDSKRQAAEYEAKMRRRRRFLLAIENDTRFPGLYAKVTSIGTPLPEAVVEALMDCADQVAVCNYLVGEEMLAKKLAAAEPEEMKIELAQIERRLSMRAV